MLIILARIRRLSALLSNNPELLFRQNSLPLVFALLNRVIRHVFCWEPNSEPKNGIVGIDRKTVVLRVKGAGIAR